MKKLKRCSKFITAITGTLSNDKFMVLCDSAWDWLLLTYTSTGQRPEDAFCRNYYSILGGRANNSPEVIQNSGVIDGKEVF